MQRFTLAKTGVAQRLDDHGFSVFGRLRVHRSDAICRRPDNLFSPLRRGARPCASTDNHSEGRRFQFLLCLPADGRPAVPPLILAFRAYGSWTRYSPCWFCLFHVARRRVSNQRLTRSDCLKGRILPALPLVCRSLGRCLGAGGSETGCAPALHPRSAPCPNHPNPKEQRDSATMPPRVASLQRMPYRHRTVSFCCECSAHRWSAPTFKGHGSMDCLRGLPAAPVHLPYRDIEFTRAVLAAFVGYQHGLNKVGLRRCRNTAAASTTMLRLSCFRRAAAREIGQWDTGVSPSAAEAIQFAIEELSPQLLVGAHLEVGEEDSTAKEYADCTSTAEYPLVRQPRSSAG